MTPNTSQGEILGRHFSTGEQVRLVWQEGRITAIEPSASGATPEVWLAPPLFDLQVNGYGGVDFQQDNLPAEALLAASRQLRAAGCARFLLTLITDEWPNLTARLRHLRWLRSQSAELQQAIAGWHIEGPFLSSEPGYHGAHHPGLQCNPAPEHLLELRTITGEDPLLVTLAPERPGGLAAVAQAAGLGIKISLGHTNAPAETLRQAVRAGAAGFTHLGNGCPRELDRYDNIIWRVFDTPGLIVSLIPDQIHVSPALFRLAHWVLGADSIYYTTDAMAAAAMPPGRYTLGRLKLDVGQDQVVRFPGNTLFAGSALRPVDGVFRAAQMLGRPWPEAWARFSDAPAKFMGLRNDLSVGQPADFCVLKVAGENQLVDLRTLVTPR